MTDLIALLEEARRIMRRMAARLRVVMDVHEDMIDDEDRLICIEIESFFDSLDAAIAELREKPMKRKLSRMVTCPACGKPCQEGAEGSCKSAAPTNAPVEPLQLPEPPPLMVFHQDKGALIRWGNECFQLGRTRPLNPVSDDARDAARKEDDASK